MVTLLGSVVFDWEVTLQNWLLAEFFFGFCTSKVALYFNGNFVRCVFGTVTFCLVQLLFLDYHECQLSDVIPNQWQMFIVLWWFHNFRWHSVLWQKWLIYCFSVKNLNLIDQLYLHCKAKPHHVVIIGRDSHSKNFHVPDGHSDKKFYVSIGDSMCPS